MAGDLDIVIDAVSKIEGHAEVEVIVRNSKVVDVQLKVEENKRFYTQAIRGKPYSGAPQLLSRICGTCSVAHLVGSTIAVEKALDVPVSTQTQLLRELTLHAMYIRDHTMHVAFFSLPDYLGIDSVLDAADTHPDLVNKAFAIKSAGNKLGKLIVGRSVHGLFAQIGSYAKVPSKEEARAMVAELRQVRPFAIEIARLFIKPKFSFERETNYVAIVGPKFDYMSGEIQSSRGTCVSPEFYYHHIQHVAKPYSQASAYTFEGNDFMLGAVSRLNMFQKGLHPNTRRDLADALALFPTRDIYNNNLAQAIETVHSIDCAIDILEQNEFKKEPVPVPRRKSGDGASAIEAPRGILYYMLSVGEDGKVRYADIVTPSAQNQINMENDLRALVPMYLSEPKEKIALEIEKLIRAYDPCFSCASHFLRLKWTEDGSTRLIQPGRV